MSGPPAQSGAAEPGSDFAAGATLRIGLVGFGAVARLHFQAYGELRSGRVVAVADANPNCLAELRSVPAIACYQDATAMLDREHLDIACILTPASSHESLANLCADRGVHVLCEKPLALTVDSARRMAAHAARCGTKLFYGSSYRFLPGVVAARKLIQAGDIGDVLMLREQAVGGRGSERATAMSPHHYPSGGPGGFAMGLVDHGIHLIDAFGWLMGSSATRATGRGNRSGGEMRTEHLTIEYANGALGHLLYNECTYATDLPTEGQFSLGDGWDVDGFVRAGGWLKNPSCIHVYGTHGSLRIFHYANLLFRFGPDGIRQVPLTGPASPGHFGSQLEAFIEDIRLDRSPTTPAEAGIAALEVLFAAYNEDNVATSG